MEDLKRRAFELDADVQKLTSAVELLADRMDRSDRDRKWYVVAILVVAAFVLAVGLIAFRSEQNIGRAEQQRSEFWCPVLGLIVGGYRQEQADARPGYQEAHNLMRHGYDVLRCTAPLVPPAK